MVINCVIYLQAD